MQNWFVVVMGLVTVFVVLILIIGLCWLLGLAAAARRRRNCRPLPLLRLLRKAAFPTAQSSLPQFRQPLPRQAVRMHLRSAFFPSRSCKNILRKVNKKYEKVSCERQRLPL